MNWGMQNRMSRIFQPHDGRTTMLAVDHGYFLGPTSGLEDMKTNIDPLVRYADCLMVTRGALRCSISPDNNVPVMLRVSGGSSVLKDLSGLRMVNLSLLDQFYQPWTGIRQDLNSLCKFFHRGCVQSSLEGCWCGQNPNDTCAGLFRCRFHSRFHTNKRQGRIGFPEDLQSHCGGSVAGHNNQFDFLIQQVSNNTF